MDENKKPLAYEAPAGLQREHSKKNFLARVILPIFGLIILIELVIGVRTLLSPVPITSAAKLQPLSAAKIYLISDKNSVNIGDTVRVTVRVATGGHATDGTDVNLKYDPNLLTASQSGFTKGSIYSEYPVVNFDNKNGQIKVSGIAAPNQGGFNGLGAFGVVSFTAKKAGATQVSVEYEGGVTTKSNIIETDTAKNLLDQGNSLSINIGSTNSSAASSGACSERVYQLCRDSQGRIGSYWCSAITDPVSCNSGCFKTRTGNEVGCNITTTK